MLDINKLYYGVTIRAWVYNASMNVTVFLSDEPNEIGKVVVESVSILVVHNQMLVHLVPNERSSGYRNMDIDGLFYICSVNNKPS